MYLQSTVMSSQGPCVEAPYPTLPVVPNAVKHQVALTPTKPPMQLPMMAFFGWANGTFQALKIMTDMAPKAPTSNTSWSLGPMKYVCRSPKLPELRSRCQGNAPVISFLMLNFNHFIGPCLCQALDKIWHSTLPTSPSYQCPEKLPRNYTRSVPKVGRQQAKAWRWHPRISWNKLKVLIPQHPVRTLGWHGWDCWRDLGEGISKGWISKGRLGR